MAPAGFRYTFGAFCLDPARHLLTRGGRPVELSDRQLEVLLELVRRHGEVVSKDALIRAGWPDVAVTDNSLEQVISALRRALGDSASGQIIHTVPRRGYRFSADTEVTSPRASGADLEALLAPHRAWVEGRAALETLERDHVFKAEQAFMQAVTLAPDDGAVHRGLANASAMRFEATRTEPHPDIDALSRAEHHAREACLLDPESGEAWATLAFVLSRRGGGTEAAAAARRAILLEPDNWRHHVRMAYATWGESRLRAARRALELFPGFALAHWLAATVHVARQTFDLAARELAAGAASQDVQSREPAGFAAVGLHWLLGLVRLARDDDAGAAAEFERELTFEGLGQVYGRECCAHTWHAIGAVRLRQGRHADAVAAFESALIQVPGHVPALVGLVFADPTATARHAALSGRLEHGAAESAFEAVHARALMMAADGDAAAAGTLLDTALAGAPAGPAGWLLPVDPLLNPHALPDAFGPMLARIRNRAA